MKKIVVTGMGAVTPVGIGVENYWNNITAGASGIDTIKTFDPSELAVQIAGEVKDFNPSDYLPKDLIRKTDPFMQYAYIAAEEAMKQSGIKIEPERTGIVMGTAMAGIATIAYTQEALTGASHKKVGPRFIPKILGNIAAANIAIDYNIQGPSFTVSTACSSGGDAINTACMCMQSGKADIMLAVGAESVLCPLVIYSLANAKALSRRNDSPSTASRPFDVTRDGFVIGEGGGALVLETEESANGRNARKYAEIKGYAQAHRPVSYDNSEVDSKAVVEVIEKACVNAGIEADNIDFVCCDDRKIIKTLMPCYDISQEIGNARAAAKKFIEEFKKNHKATCCRVLTAGLDMASPERKAHCTNMVNDCSKILEEMIKVKV